MNIPDEIQSIIEKMANHLAAQGQQSMNVYGSCKYRGPNGLKCAVGALLSDEACEGDIEGRAVTLLYDEHFTDAEGTEARDELEQLRGSVSEDAFKAFLDKCQSYHDTPVGSIWAGGSMSSYKGRIEEGTATVEVITEDLKAIWRSVN